ncbi:MULTISPECIES: porin family protein [unclassified Sinorhizobium]|uniref:outer membrane protein n=1 Tax=unclassified Sinorhizobium TaxID=2613772 RepID=UPI0024C321FA|nr:MULTISPECIES: porin family protein [unclassified Sinorhizobium]MDK1372875.1 porin family protein [Sinorhizobium sp. 6-70]MDK1477145.1 porin family protein [Sinorhizobium sp. 6-117]MDK1477186.1 porin family protein [Sinorhizobium sp. 6-117]
MSRTMLVAIFGASLLAGTSNAADLTEAPAPAPVVEAAPTFVWTGGYVGLQGGGGWLNSDLSVPGASASEDFNGGLLGAFAGYNYQHGDWVLGIEGDVTYNWNDKTINAFGANTKVGTDVSGSVRGRVGYTLNEKALLYATGGWAVTRGFVDVPGAPKEKETFNGWTIGAGVDYGFTSNVFGRAEYRYNDFGDEDIDGVNVDLDQHQFTVGVGVKF